MNLGGGERTLKSWSMPSVRISSQGCTRELRAREKRKGCLSSLQTSQARS